MGKTKKFFMYLILTVASILSVFPLYYMFCASTNRSIDVIAGKLIPGTYLMENFKSLIAQQNLRLALWNSFRNATVLTVLCLLVCSIAGYGFEIYHDKAKDAVFTVLLTAMMIPFAAIMIPMFRMFSQLKMVNTMAAFMLPSISTPFMIMMFRQASRSFPHDIIEAARLDGLSETGIFFRMYMPTMKSTYAAATIITFMNAWNNYLWPKVILQNNESITMPMLVANLLGGYTVDYGVLMLGVFICTIPTAIIFFCFQKHFLCSFCQVTSLCEKDLCFRILFMNSLINSSYRVFPDRRCIITKLAVNIICIWASDQNTSGIFKRLAVFPVFQQNHRLSGKIQ